MVYLWSLFLYLTTDMSPTEFAAQEEMERQTWKVNIVGDYGTYQRVDTSVFPNLRTPHLFWQDEGGRHDPSSPEDHLDREIHKEGFASVSRQLGEKILSDSLGARNNSMVSLKGNIITGLLS